MYSTFLSVCEPRVYLNDELAIIPTGRDWSDNAAISWAEFAKGRSGSYATIEDAVKTRRLLDAIGRSIKEGRVITL